MKAIFVPVFLAFLLCGLSASGQSLRVVFDYDAAGNRILRTATISDDIPVPPMPAADSVAINQQDTVTATFRVNVYPNPVQTNLWITITVLDGSPQLPATFDVRLVDMQGTVFYHHTHASDAPIQVNMYNGLTGWYQLRVTRGAEIQQLTILKQ